MLSAFEVDVSSQIFVDFTKALYNIRPAKPLIPGCWSLDRALQLALSNRFQHDTSPRDLSMVTVFLVSLALGARSSEVHALLCSDDNLVF